MRILFEYSPWLIVPIALLAGLYAYLLYSGRSAELFGKTYIRLLAAIRFLVVLFIGTLLLNPRVLNVDEVVEKPVFIVAQDNSRSIVGASDSSFNKNELGDALKNAMGQLEEEAEIIYLGFDSKVVPDDKWGFGGRSTNIAGVFDYVRDNFADRSVSGILLSTDGIFNLGLDPAYYSFKKNIPVFTLALGDTNKYPEISIDRITANKIAYVDDEFPVEIAIKLENVSLKYVDLNIYKSGINVYSYKVRVDEGAEFIKHRFNLKANQPGKHYYTAAISEMDDEKNVINNRGDWYIEVVDTRKKVLFVAGEVQPDIGIIKTILDEKQRFETDLVFLSRGENVSNLPDYDLIITSGLPSKRYPEVFDRIERSGKPAIHLISSLSSPENLPDYLTFDGRSRMDNMTKASWNPAFTVFSLEPQLLERLDRMPPVRTPFGELRGFEPGNVVFYQKVGKVQTMQPVVFFTQLDTKKAWFWGEGFFRWWMYEYRDFESRDLFTSLIDKTVQYLTIDDREKRIHVSTKSRMDEDEETIFTAEVYDLTYNLINEPSLDLTIYDEDRKEYQYSFVPDGKGYRLNAGQLPPGVYQYAARTNVGGELLIDEGSFVITRMEREMADIRARYGSLYMLSERTGGKMYSSRDLDNLGEDIVSSTDFSGILRTTENEKGILDYTLVLILLLALATIEWVVRKREGSY
jgi:hypothetical protein